MGALSSGRLGRELHIAIAVTFDNSVACIVPSLTIVILWLRHVLAACSLIDLLRPASLISCLWCCFELIEVGRLLADLGHFDFVSAPIVRAHGQGLLVG